MDTRHSLGPIALAALLALGACGGGGDNAPAAAPPAATPLSLSGTAATGGAIPSAPVAVKCASGTGTATTGADGRYTVSLASATAPCIVEVTNGASKLYSVVEAGSATTATVNVTPLTSLLTAQAAGGDPAALFTTFDAAGQARLSAAALTTARSDLTAALAGRVDLAGFDPIKTPFVVGDANDMKLVTLQTVLTTAQLTLTELSAALVANPGSAAPIQTALAPSAAGCPALKSATVRFVSLFGIERGTIDASALTYQPDGGAAVPFSDQGDCTFLTPSTGTVALVSRSSIGVNRFPLVGGGFSMSFGFPEQTIPVSDLAGTWNIVGYTRDPSVTGSVFAPEHGTIIINSSGAVVTPGVDCTGFNTCRPGDSGFAFTVNAQGGFNIIDSATMVVDGARAFGYRAPSGTVMLFISPNSPDNTGFYVLTKQTVTPLPPNGLVTPFSLFTIGSSGAVLAGASGMVTTNVSTITSVDASGTGSFTRTLSDGHAETILLNTPRDGMRRRMAGSSPGSNGMPVSFNAVVQLQPPDTGLTLSLSTDPAQNFFNAAIFAPTP